MECTGTAFVTGISRIVEKKLLCSERNKKEKKAKKKKILDNCRIKGVITKNGIWEK